jgi:nucleotide-binding universal stress UspA family protein
MFERILVPLDSSKLAEVALPYAEEIAGRLVSDVKLVHIVESDTDPYRNMRQVYLQKMAEVTRSGVEKHLIKPPEREIKVDPIILVGDPAWEIVNYADEESIGLIVMVTRGLSGIKRWTLGNVADRVVRTTEMPVVLIRAKGDRLGGHEKGIFNKVLVCLDGSRESEAILTYVGELASKFKAEVVLIEVAEKGYYFAKAGGYEYVFYPEEQTRSAKAFIKDYLDKVGSQLKQKGIAVNSEVRVGDAAEEIIRFADEISADVVAMTTHGRSGIARWAVGSVADKVLREGTPPPPFGETTKSQLARCKRDIRTYEAIIIAIDWGVEPRGWMTYTTSRKIPYSV